MAFGKKKVNKDTSVYDLDSHSDKPTYETKDMVPPISNGIGEFADHLLIAELEFRGYMVTKK